MARADGMRLALLVDDAQLLDEASAALTHQLAANAGAFVLATIRTGEPASDAVVALWKDGITDRVDLRPFSAAEVEQALAAARAVRRARCVRSRAIHDQHPTHADSKPQGTASLQEWRLLHFAPGWVPKVE